MARMKWEYLSARFDFLGRGITQEFDILDVDGERLHGKSEKDKRVAETLPEFLEVVGEDGWELVTHTISEGRPSDGLEWHYMTFKRPKAS